MPGMGGGVGAIGGGGGLGDMLGDDDALEMEMQMQNQDATGLNQNAGIKIRVFINMDEDDPNERHIDLKRLFKLKPDDLPQHVDVSNQADLNAISNRNENEIILD